MASFIGNRVVEMLEIIVASFLSKLGVKLADYAQHTVMGITDHTSILGALQRNLKSLIARASDVEEEIKKAELSGKKKRKRQVENWLTEVQKLESNIRALDNEVKMEGFVGKFFGGDRAGKLSARVDELVEESRHFGELVLDVLESRGEALLTTRLVGVEFEKNLERIWKLLVVDKVSSIGIYGMGGVGKTTLAKHLNNQLLEKAQECVVWVTISQEFSITVLQDRIAHVLDVHLSDEYDEDKRAARLNRALSRRKNFVLILDDVWKNINLEKVGDPLSVEGCRLMITTRSLEVCHQIGCREVIEVKKLDGNEAWDLFSGKLGEKTALTPQVQEIVKSVVKLCDGLPLGIITLAGSMRGETSIHVWENALTELRDSVWGQEDMEDEVFKVLKYSFDRLGERQGKRDQYTKLQLCFLYFCLYPEDYKTSRDELIRKFILEELLDKRKSRKALFDQGHTILNKLVNACLLEEVEGSSGDVKMHDLVRAMALQITPSKTMALGGLKKIPNEEEWTEDLEKVSLMKSYIQEIPEGMTPNCPKLLTLILNEIRYLKIIPDSFISRMRGLSILDLSWCHDLEELPNSLSDMVSLKALLLSGCGMLVKLPYLGKLKAMKELDLLNTGIHEVPQGMEQLINLNHLSLEGSKIEILPGGLLLNFPNLQCLHLPLEVEAPVEEIDVLKHLEEFCGRVRHVRDFNRFIGIRHNTSYCIQVGLIPQPLALRLFNKLGFHEYNLKKEDDENVSVLAQNIQHLEFVSCDGLSSNLLDDLGRLNNPTSLKTLEIEKCRGMECIVTYEQLMGSESHCLPLQTLEQIHLFELPDFMRIIIRKKEIVASPSLPQTVFSSLRQLWITKCGKMKKLGLPASEFQNLEEIIIRDCGELQEIIEVAEDDGSSNVVILPKLKWLHLIGLPSLKSICNATTVCGSIEILEMSKCLALKKLTLVFGQLKSDDSPPSPSALKEIYLDRVEKEWWQSLDMEHPTYKLLLQPFVRFWG